MTKKELFKKYSINESHNVWDDQIDNWMSIEVYRIMHDGNLPSQDDLSVEWVTDFLDKMKNDFEWWAKTIMIRKDWGSLFLTSKRMVYILADKILEIKNKKI
jgi:hypothetical protein